MDQVNLYVEVWPKVIRSGPKQYGYVLETEFRGETRTIEGFGETLGTYNQATLFAIWRGLLRMNRNSHITIHAQDGFILSTIRDKMPDWVRSGYRGKTGEPWKNNLEWQRMYSAAAVHELDVKIGKSPYTNWLTTQEDTVKETVVLTAQDFDSLLEKCSKDVLSKTKVTDGTAVAAAIFAEMRGRIFGKE